MDKLAAIFDVADKTVLITGAGGFLGRYISTAFLDVGANVILLSRSDKLQRQVSEYHQRYGLERTRGFQVDCYDRVRFKDILETAVGSSPVHALINNAYDLSPRTGFNTHEGYLENAPFQQWQQAFEAGIYWAVQSTQIVGEHFRRHGCGSIINISSMYGLVAPDPDIYEGTAFMNPPTYSVIKSALLGLTRYTASFWGKYGIRCNAVLPGPFPNTESRSDNSVKHEEPFLDRIKEKTVLKRFGHPTELTGILIYLASNASSYMTGQAIVIDGGWTII